MIPINEQSYPLPNGWRWCRLGDVCQITPPKISTCNLADDLEVSFIPMSAISETSGEITAPQKKFLYEVKNGFTNFAEGDVLFARITPCMENGKSALVGKLVNHIGYGSTEFFVLRCGEQVLNRFVYHLVRWRIFRDEAKSVMAGSVGQQRVPKKFLLNYKLPLPPIDEQQRIVDLLDELFAKLDEAKNLVQAVFDGSELRRAAILHKTFTGEISYLWREKHSTTLDSWQRCPLGYVCNYGCNETVQPSAMKVGKLLIGLEDIEKDSGKLIRRKFFDGTNATSPKHAFRRGNVLYGKLRPYLNKVIIADMDGYCSSEILPLDFSERVLNSFAQYILLSPDFVQYANQNSYGTNMPRLGMRAGQRAPFPLPPLAEQKEIVRLLDDLLYREQQTKNIAGKILERVELLKEYILAQVFCGKFLTNKLEESLS